MIVKFANQLLSLNQRTYNLKTHILLLSLLSSVIFFFPSPWVGIWMAAGFMIWLLAMLPRITYTEKLSLLVSFNIGLLFGPLTLVLLKLLDYAAKEEFKKVKLRI